MDITTLLSPERVSCETEVSSKKRAFEQLAALLVTGYAGLEAETIFHALINREKLGSTAIGNGVAIPHACLPIPQPLGALLVLEDGIKMDAPDKKPVQLFLAILAPANEAPNYSELITRLTGTLLQKSLIEQMCRYNDRQGMLDQFRAFFDPPERPPEGVLAA
ncbi:PTS sugar transporter subunit IIA [Thiothrix nivea]|uniref:Putative PTS IIA-like nitrogen-regulatory protein PtsN n=1 Tax=Thiothrix nivea (strain ATCC 35100 / DSM 5205 / JP2) TaxID=870187 RepID=A0A656HEJ2_THINJ|nr:PTS sugar transporter subunit IIA [Thiothrix nivea]EIJ33830.1 putative PTS IIA-like nitrogen-regulatory protein PtsN [Thiothrix nivea DSM 5205]